jgi:hypothetical protein
LLSGLGSIVVEENNYRKADKHIFPNLWKLALTTALTILHGTV